MTMQESTANDFYERLVEGTDYVKTVSLEHSSGLELTDVEMHPVEKGVLADVIQSLPDEMFEAVEQADDPDEAEEMMEGDGMSISSMDANTVEAFENLVKESLRHPELTGTQIDHIVEELGFGKLFEMGGEIIDMSFSEGGAIKDFRAQE